MGPDRAGEEVRVTKVNERMRTCLNPAFSLSACPHEIRSVLTCMTQVLDSCFTLLDSTQIPVDGIVRLLQHILRPQQQELQMWASQLLLGKGMSMEDLQKKFETQAAVAELLKMLRPNGTAAAASGDQGTISVSPASLHNIATATLRNHVQLKEQLVQHQQQQGGGAAAPQSQQKQPSAAAAASLPPPSAAAAYRQQQLTRGPHPEPGQCLSLEREWDWETRGDLGGSPAGPSSGGGAQNGIRRRSKKQQQHQNPHHGKGQGGQGGRPRSRYERYMDVEAFWRSTTPEQRRELLRVPMGTLLQAVRQDHGPEAAEEVCEGLVLLREQGNVCARYWACPLCDQRFSTSKDYMAHVEMVHEELAVVDDKYEASELLVYFREGLSSGVDLLHLVPPACILPSPLRCC